MIAKIHFSQENIADAIRSYLEACGHKATHVKLTITAPSSDGPIHAPGHVTAEATVSMDAKHKFSACRSAEVKELPIAGTPVKPNFI